MKIIQNPNQILRKKATKIKKISLEIEKIISHMRQGLKKTTAGLALAAPQIGIDKAIVVMGYKAKDEETGKIKTIVPERVLINPRIIKSSKEQITEEEGCLSFMGKEEIRGNVARAKKVTVLAQDENDNKVKIEAEGFFARVLQHEIDHLNGVLFVDRADPKTIYRVSEKDDEAKKEKI